MTSETIDNSLAVITTAAEGMTLWSDEKKKDFVQTFEARSRAARYILWFTGHNILATALRRQFISQKSSQELRAEYPQHAHVWSDPQNYRCVGGRAAGDLDAVAAERAEKTLANLPRLKDAVRVIAPDVAKKIDKIDELKEEGKPLAEELETLSTPIDMDDLPEETTVGAFKKMVTEREERREVLLKALNKIGAKGQKLEIEVAQALYSGLPGLSDQVLKVAKEHFERAKAMEQTARRVTEQVLFGDSAAATELLAKFEKDEQKLDESVAAEFQTAMAALKQAAKEGKKLLGKGKK